MRDDGIIRVVEALVSADPAVLDRDQVDEALASLRRVQGWAQAGLLACTRRLNELARVESGVDKSDGGSSVTANQSLIDAAGQSPNAAAATQGQVGLCSLDAGLEDSLAAGKVTAAHLDVIARCARQLDGAARCEFDSRMVEFRELAATLHVASFDVRMKALVRDIRQRHRPQSAEEELERQRAASSVKDWVDRETGIHKFLLSMDPVRAAKFRSALRAELGALRSGDANRGVPYGSLQVDAVINAMSGGAATARSPELVIHIDIESLLDGQHADSLCETDDGDPVPVGLVRDLAANAVIHFVKVDGLGTVHEMIDNRVANRRQRRALSAIYRTCCFSDCQVPVADCRAHHVKWARQGGVTRLGNLVPVCETHHHAIHDQGWQCDLDETTRVVTWTPPYGGTPQSVAPNRRPRRQRSGRENRPAAARGAPPGSRPIEHPARSGGTAIHTAGPSGP